MSMSIEERERIGVIAQELAGNLCIGIKAIEKCKRRFQTCPVTVGSGDMILRVDDMRSVNAMKVRPLPFSGD